MAGAQQGSIRGLGQYKVATLNAVIAYYGVSLTTGYYFTFHLGNGGIGLNGLWYGMFTGQLVLCILN